jgi:hypothetical protein
MSKYICNDYQFVNFYNSPRYNNIMIACETLGACNYGSAGDCWTSGSRFGPGRNCQGELKYGNSNDAYELWTATHLLQAIQDMNNGTWPKDATLTLMADINLAENSPPDALYSNNEHTLQLRILDTGFDNFQGTFNGNGKTISNFKITTPASQSSTTEGVGLFFSNRGTIKNAIFKNFEMINDTWRVGLVGTNYGTIQDCTFAGSIKIFGRGVCGLIGNNQGTISNPSADITDVHSIIDMFEKNESTYPQCGGLVGVNKDTGTIEFDSLTLANLSITGIKAGGIVGANWGAVKFNSFNCVNVLISSEKLEEMSNSCKESYVGGLAGENTGSIGPLTSGGTAVANFDMNSQIEARDKADATTTCTENIYAGAFVGYNGEDATLENINLIYKDKNYTSELFPFNPSNGDNIDNVSDLKFYGARIFDGYGWEVSTNVVAKCSSESDCS